VETATAADGATISYEIHGAGPPLVLLHGITESHRTWDPLIDQLALDARVIAVDHRGHGQSERKPPFDALTLAADLHAVVTAAGAQEPLVVGHSLGGAVVSIYASTYPVRGVVNIDQGLDIVGFKELLATIEPQLRGTEQEFATVLENMFEGLYGPLPAGERKRIEAHGRRDQDVVLGLWDMIMTGDVDDVTALISGSAAAITAPYLAIHGSDPGAGYREWLANTIPTSTLEVWEGDGHYPHLVEPDRFLARLHDFDHAI
jgi:pimeloyl-ACP methyl ester carboxylesterase